MISVGIDSQEKDAILFPKKVWVATAKYGRVLHEVRKRRGALPEGDYLITDKRGHELLIENKDGLRELGYNLCTRDRRRFLQAWGRFLKWPGPKMLLIDESLALSRVPKEAPYREEDVIMELNALLLDSPGVQVVWSGRSRSVASRIMLGTRLIQLATSYQESHLILPKGAR